MMAPMNRELKVGHMLFTVNVKDGLATWSVRPSEAVEMSAEKKADINAEKDTIMSVHKNKHTKVLFSGIVTEDMGDELLKLSWVIRHAEDVAKGKINE